MRIARILYPVTVLGPGKRIGIWLAGCSKRCKGCANPELWDGENYPDMNISDLIDAVHILYEKANGQVDGITISGGEPFEQVEELLSLVLYLKEMTEDILIFSGKTREELLKNEISEKVLEVISVLVDGEYIETKNAGEVLRGSQNQNIYLLNETMAERYKEYQDVNKDKYLVENFRVSDGVIAVGIHKKDFKEALHNILERKQIFPS